MLMKVDVDWVTRVTKRASGYCGSRDVARLLHKHNTDLTCLSFNPSPRFAAYHRPIEIRESFLVGQDGDICSRSQRSRSRRAALCCSMDPWTRGKALRRGDGLKASKPKREEIEIYVLCVAVAGTHGFVGPSRSQVFRLHELELGPMHKTSILS
jgi:hypothetical protein